MFIIVVVVLSAVRFISFVFSLLILLKNTPKGTTIRSIRLVFGGGLTHFDHIPIIVEQTHKFGLRTPQTIITAARRGASACGMCTILYDTYLELCKKCRNRFISIEKEYNLTMRLTSCCCLPGLDALLSLTRLDSKVINDVSCCCHWLLSSRHHVYLRSKMVYQLSAAPSPFLLSTLAFLLGHQMNCKPC